MYEIVQIIHAHIYVDKSHAKNTHTNIRCFLKQVSEIQHSLSRPHHLPATFIHIGFICGLDCLYSGVDWTTMSRNK
jgi:hypothetical protein